MCQHPGLPINAGSTLLSADSYAKRYGAAMATSYILHLGLTGHTFCDPKKKKTNSSADDCRPTYAPSNIYIYIWSGFGDLLGDIRWRFKTLFLHIFIRVCRKKKKNSDAVGMAEWGVVTAISEGGALVCVRISWALFRPSSTPSEWLRRPNGI